MAGAAYLLDAVGNGSGRAAIRIGIGQGLAGVPGA